MPVFIYLFITTGVIWMPGSQFKSFKESHAWNFNKYKGALGRAWQCKMWRMQGWSCPQGFSSISQFQHKSTNISCSRKVNSITRSSLLCSSSRTAARQPRLENPNLKLFSVLPSWEKLGSSHCPKKNNLFVFSYTETGKDATTLTRAVSLSKTRLESPMCSISSRSDSTLKGNRHPNRHF